MKKVIHPQRRHELAALVGSSEQYLYQCLTGRRDMGAAEARRVEVATNGELNRQMLCQKTWQAIWPELATPATNCEQNHPAALDGKALGATATTAE